MCLQLRRPQQLAGGGGVGGDASSHVPGAFPAASAAPDTPCCLGCEHARAVADSAGDHAADTRAAVVT